MKLFQFLSFSIISTLVVSAVNVIENCKPGYVALTYDDGPYIYTNELAQYLTEQGIKATFFINGNNFWSLNNEQEAQKAKDAISTAYYLGHQIASHSWSHQDFNAISSTELESEIDLLENAVESIIHKRPAFLRPPYGNVNDQALKILESKGYKTVTWSTDTKDYESHDITQERQNIRSSFSRRDIDRGFIILSHDVYQQTTTELTRELIQYIKAEGFKFATVAECVGANPYK